jgi:hypothetical protein
MKKTASLLLFLPLILWISGCSLGADLKVIGAIADSIGGSSAEISRSASTDKGKLITLTFKGIKNLHDENKSICKSSSAARMYFERSAAESFEGYDKLVIRLEDADSSKEITYTFRDLRQVKGLNTQLEKIIHQGSSLEKIRPYCDKAILPDSTLQLFCSYLKQQDSIQGPIKNLLFRGFSFTTYSDSTATLSAFSGLYLVGRDSVTSGLQLLIRELDTKLVGFRIYPPRK